MPKPIARSRWCPAETLLRGSLVFTLILTAAPRLGAEGDPVEPSGVSPRRIRFDHLNNKQGLSQNSVMAIVQDRQGFMWFGTYDGLNRYDGYRFRHFQHRPRDPSSLAGGWVQELLQDRSGVLWAGTDGGLSRLDPLHETITRYRPDPDDPGSLSHGDVTALWEDRAGTLWVGTTGGLNRFDALLRSFAPYRYDPDDPGSLSHDAVLSIHEDRAGALWIGTDGGGLNRLDAHGSFVHYRHDPDDPSSLGHDVVNSIYEDGAGTLWIGTENGLDRLGPDGFTHYRHDPQDPRSLGHDEVRAVLEDTSGTLWIGTRGGGLNRFDPVQERFVRYVHDPKDPGSLSDDDVLSLYEDRFGGLWVGTDGGALNRFDPTEESFAHYRHDPDDASSLSHDDVMALHPGRSGTLWVGTDGGGLNQVVPAGPDAARRSFRHFRHDPDDASSLSDDDVFALYEDLAGALWVGTRNGLNRLTPERTGFTRYRHDPDDASSLSHDDVRALLGDSAGRLWIGTVGGGLDRLDLGTPDLSAPDLGTPGRARQSFARFRHDPDDASSLSHDDVRALFEDRSGTLWVGTRGGGLNRFEPGGAGGTWIRYRHDPDDPSSLSHDYVRTIYEDRSGTLWLGTYGGGLNRFVPGPEAGRRATFEHFTERDGLANNVVYGILEDDLGRLWLGTNRGLSRFDPRTETWTGYDVRDGLQDDEFNSGAYGRSASGEMFFGGIHGFNAFHPERFKEIHRVTPLYLTSFKVFERDAELARSVSYVEEIALRYRENFFSFEFAALNFQRSDRNRYRYRLEGFDDGWVDAGSRPSASYTKVRSGHYVFRVQASNNEGGWNEDGIAVALSIIPPLWQTWWFRALQGLGVFGLLAGLFLLQRQRLRREQRNEIHRQELERKTEELEFARQVQLSMLPKSNLATESLEVFGCMITATELGGDYYDIIPVEDEASAPEGSLSASEGPLSASKDLLSVSKDPLSVSKDPLSVSKDSGKVCIVIGDAMGHGMAAGLVVGMLKAAIVHSLKRLAPESGPAGLIRALNVTLKESLPIRRLGMGLGVAMLDGRSLEVDLCSTGMPFPYFYRAADTSLTAIELEGLPLGLWDRIDVRSHGLALSPGDVLVFVSDGVPERRDVGDDVWGYSALEDSLLAFCRQEKSAEAIASRLIAACDSFAGGREPEDDMTVVVVRAR